MKSSGRRREIPIGELAETFGLATHVLRHWESTGLLAPHRSSAGHRVYGPADRYRVAAILQAKEAGMGLDDIRAILTAPTPSERNAVLQRQHDELTKRIAEAQAALRLIDTALGCEHGDLATCPRFQAVLAERVGPD
ncbi:MerR family transcriptional regulator [Mycobacterium hubeiense]|uniref:helix-turn-helix domain-containing protein n=1 Tax=Mycobacterium hubeiense TaxID=1867256 RepID=UPI000C7F64C1|nr:MerR family transcriptional regulator [Mycobacterium sp. QGD 101]